MTWQDHVYERIKVNFCYLALSRAEKFPRRGLAANEVSLKLKLRFVPRHDDARNVC